MHNTAYMLGQLFIQSYIPKNGRYTLIELGSDDINGSLRKFCPANTEYIGLDFAEGKNVDIVLKSSYELPFKDNSIDFVISTSCFEHSEFFWLSFKEIFRVLKSSGLFYVNAPSNGTFHRHPMDCWRFYPDASLALLKWAAHCGHERPCILESFMKEPEDMQTIGPIIKEQQKIINDCVEKKLSLSKLQSSIWEKSNTNNDNFTISDLDDDLLQNLLEKDISADEEPYKMK